MEKCLPKYLRVYGSTYYRYYGDIYFRRVVHHIRDKINDFILKKDKEPLKDICLYLSNYLINNKNPPNYYAPQRELWERSLYEWLNPHYKKLDKLGGCPLIMNQNDLEILELKYNVDDFCEKRESYLDELRQSQGNPKSNSNYSSKCDSYNEWIDGKEKYFTTKKELFKNCYKIEKTQKGRRKTCNIIDPKTFNKLPNCRSTVQKRIWSTSNSKNKNLPEVTKKESERASMREDQEQKRAPDILETEPQPEPQSRSQHEDHSALEKGIAKESQIISPVTSSPESSSIKTKDDHEDPGQHTQSKLSVFPKSAVSTESQKSPVSITLPTSLGVSGTPIDYQNIRLSSGSSNFPDNSMPSKILELIMENTKSINNIEKQKILWNKWVKEHKKEKDLWKKWISKKHMIIEQYLQQKWFDEFTQEFLNMSDEYVNEESKNNISLLNSEELQSKECYEELYSYIKKKLIAKMCILFMMVLEDCKTEDFIKNEESHLDNSINDWKTDSNLGRKSDAPKQVIHVNATALEHRKNGQIRAQIGQKSFRQEIEEWIKEDDTGANYIYNENSVELSY
ncbi:STP1 protein [Plasmodium malariae]|uniref:STP1 protein n=1 Tax=Plasmodium malariae TaxID=5858 RepID=A0A1D3JH88_PLAMA|nr:STP1 protein [Plasmodium malariae]SBT85665.1 STP1 protein [Plasmodium malariae]